VTPRQAFEASQPWVVYRYGRTHDRWWPPWTSSRVLGRAHIECMCAVCGTRQIVTLRLPRFGPVPAPPIQADGVARDAARQRFLDRHTHPDRGDPAFWAMPLLNPAIQPDMGNLAARLDSDLRGHQ
jgi:hypothetical protein